MRSPRGVKHWSAKLTDQDVRLIRTLHEHGMQYSEIAKKFDVSWNTVYDVCQWKTWKHIS